jgi:hypothetical protein
MANQHPTAKALNVLNPQQDRGFATITDSE